MPHRALVVNVLGGPGAGKTTFAAGLFYELKKAGYNVEYVQEYAKKLVWLKRWEELDNQFGVSRKQYLLLHAVANSVDCIVTDGPLAHGFYYVEGNADCVSDVTKTKDALRNWIGEFESYNFFVDRSGAIPYVDAGRYQSEAEAFLIDTSIKEALRVEDVAIDMRVTARSSPGAAASAVMEQIRYRLKA